MQVVIYSSTNCPFCRQLKDYLLMRSVSFTERMIDNDEIAKKEMETASGGFLGVPFTVIKKDNGEEIKIIGFDKAKLDEILQISQ